ncbi:MAG: hypothetical protein CM1200mP30_11810 [Pseudomonadota bacterium]|nr:MAG: hypothetical protein CM1200mP30_11810 [Pseudomonadota bacterium]
MSRLRDQKAKDQGQPDFGNTYYQFGLCLETILLEKNIPKKSDLKSSEQWRHPTYLLPRKTCKLVKYK